MNHNKLRQYLSLYIDGQVTAEEKNLVERHLAECHACSNDLNRLQSARRSLQDVDAPKVRPFFAQRVLAEYDANNRERFWTLFEWLPRPVVYAGLALSVVVICLLTTPQAELENNGALAQLYGEPSVTLLETDDQALAFALQHEYRDLIGE